MPGTPSDWVSGERVFAPPRGTVDVDWLVPAVLELVPGASPAQARAALEKAWAARRSGDGDADPGRLAHPAPGTDPAGAGSVGAGPPAPVAEADLHSAADRVLVEALDTFGG